MSDTLKVLAAKPVTIPADVHHVQVAWNASKKTGQKAAERHLLIPAHLWASIDESVKDEAVKGFVIASFKALAESILKKSGHTLTEINPEVFSVPALLALHEETLIGWISKEDLEKDFLASATWAKIKAHPQWKENAKIRALAEKYKDAVLLACNRRQGRVEQDEADKVLARIHEDDLEAPWAQFVSKRYAQFVAKPVQEITPEDFDVLDY